MPRKTCYVALGLALLLAGTARAEIFRGFMSITGAEMG